MSKTKVVDQTEIPELPLPEGANWDTLINRPTSLADISISDATTLEGVSSGAPAGGLDLAIQGWALSSIFSATGQQAVAWTAGTLTFKDGTSYSIALGSVAAISMSAPTYIYFNKAVSTTVLQSTTTATTAVGQNKVLIAVLQGNSASGKNAVFTAFGNASQSQYVGTANIAASSITSALIAAGTIVASNIAANTITANEIAANTITTAKLTATAIDGMTITGAVVRTAASGARVQMTTSALEIYDSSRLRASSWSQGMTFYDASGNYTADIYAGSTGGLLITTSNSGSSSRSIYIQAGSSGVASLGIGGTSYIYANGPTSEVYLTKDLIPTTSSQTIGSSSGYNIGSIFTTFLYLNTVGYVNSGGTSGTPYPASSFSITHTATGRYSITHPFGSTNYVVIPVAVASTVKNISVESRGSSSFAIRIANLADALEDNDFMFIFIPAS